MASSAEPCSDEAIGSTVKVRFSKAPAIVSSARRFAVIASMPSFVAVSAAAGSALIVSMVSTSPFEQPGDDVGALLEEVRGDDQVRRDELTVRPQVALVDEHVAAPFEDQAGRPRLGDPGAVELALPEQRERLGVLDVDDGDVAATRRVGGEAVVGEPGAQGDVLGVAEGGRGEGRAGEIVGGVDPVGDDQARPARRGAGDDPQGLTVGLGETVDRRVGADEGGVDRSREQRLDRLAAGVEVGDLERDVRSQGVGEDSAVHADDRRGVGDVGEVAEAQGDRPGFGGACRRRGGGRAGCGARQSHGGEDQQAPRDDRLVIPTDIVSFSTSRDRTPQRGIDENVARWPRGGRGRRGRRRTHRDPGHRPCPPAAGPARVGARRCRRDRPGRRRRGSP